MEKESEKQNEQRLAEQQQGSGMESAFDVDAEQKEDHPLQQVANSSPQVRELRQYQHIASQGQRNGTVSQLQAGPIQMMRTQDVRVGKWYQIQGIQGARHLRQRRGPTLSKPGYYFYTSPDGPRKKEHPLIIDSAAKIIREVPEPQEKAPIADAQAWGQGANDNKVFGLDGKNEEAVEAAIDAGYRCFDAAETYSFKLRDLVRVCASKNLPREAIKVVFKVGHGATKRSLHAVIGSAIATIRYIDVLMVHEPTPQLEQVIDAINYYIAQGMVKTGGMSNVSADNLHNIHVSKLSKMTVLQENVQSIMADKLMPGGSTREHLEKATGNKVRMSYYGIQGIKFSEVATKALADLNVTPNQARQIYMRELQADEVASSSNAARIQQNFATPQVSEQVWDQVVAIVEKSMNPLSGMSSSGGHMEEEKKDVKRMEAKHRGDSDSEEESGWAHPFLKTLYLKANACAMTNDIYSFLAEVNKMPGTLMRIVKKFPKLNLVGGDLMTRQVYAKINWPELLNGSAQALGNACNQQALLQAIAKAILAYNTRLNGG